MAGWREELHPRDQRGRFTFKGSVPAVSIKHTVTNLDDVERVSDEDILDVFGRMSRAKKLDDKTLTRLLAELARREGLAQLPPPAPVTDEERHCDQLIARGYSYAEAYEEAYGRSAGRGSGEVIERRAGETLDHARRRAYAEMVTLQALQAEEATRANLVSKKCRGVDPVTLWSAAAAHARRCASEELKRWWEANGGRRTYTEWRASLGDAGARRKAAAARTAGNGKDFGV